MILKKKNSNVVRRMCTYRYSLVYIFIITVIYIATQNYISVLAISEANTPLLIVISFGGIRWDYITDVHQKGYETKNINKLIANGVLVENLGTTDATYTKTFPSNFAIATGIYRENHVQEIMENGIFNVSTSDVTKISTDQNNISTISVKNNLYKQFIPIWNRNEQKFSRRSGIISWPDMNISNYSEQLPYYYYYEMDSSSSHKVEIDKLLNLFTDPDKSINLGMVYINKFNITRHDFETDNNQFISKVLLLDKMVGYLIQRLQKLNLFKSMNVILTSDHDLITKGDISEVDIYVERGSRNSKVWNVFPSPGGQHDTNITFIAQHPLFIGHGPAFKSKVTTEPFRSVDVYPLMCHILGLEPPRNIDGSLQNVIHILHPNDHAMRNITGIVLAIFGIFISVVCYISICCLYQRWSRRIRPEKAQTEFVYFDGYTPLLNSDSEEEFYSDKIVIH